MSGGKSKQQSLSQVEDLITGLPKYCANMSFTVNGETYTTPQVVQLCTALVSADDATIQAKAAYAAVVAAEHALLTSTMSVVKVVRTFLEMTFGNAPATLAGLGVTPRKKPTPLTTQALAARAAKAKATRAARGTTSKKQKATVFGNVTGVIITPVTPGTPPAAASPVSTPQVAPTSIVAAASGTTHA